MLLTPLIFAAIAIQAKPIMIDMTLGHGDAAKKGDVVTVVYRGSLQDGKVFDRDGRYGGTLVGDRIVFRTVDSAAVGKASEAAACPPSTHANRKGSGLWGIEPPFGH